MISFSKQNSKTSRVDSIINYSLFLVAEGSLQGEIVKEINILITTS